MRSTLLLATGLTASFVTSVTTLVDPGRKWMTLRGAELAIQSELWKFRTRTGEYQGPSSAFNFAQREEAERKAKLPNEFVEDTRACSAKLWPQKHAFLRPHFLNGRSLRYSQSRREAVALLPLLQTETRAQGLICPLEAWSIQARISLKWEVVVQRKM
eukprot:CAMPEP_0115380934 /NCGR_PEP_ID=MMETSP0271-20121206/5306_1 /TAXON_ID=71861 /ORGANISM="Scrippsiella trochoidea, Strain CCMP3099" /LENGTH=157 /DNA_ID=CAMNT_0002804189 /DNA_START=102 /DNA_END=575 /DNA_ORIENTATION=+